MNRTNYHTHSNYCHGVGELELYVKSAIERKMSAIGFSSHAPIPFKSDWHMSKSGFDDYRKELVVLKRKYNKELAIYSGLEVDYISGIIGPKNFSEFNLDILIGSVHYVGCFANGENCCIDNTVEDFEMGLKFLFGNDIKKMVRAYYNNIIEMVQSDPPDIIGHLDLIKKLNKDNKYFNENDVWYINIVDKVTSVIANSNSIVEINTRGYYKGFTKEFYPGKLILEKCLGKNIPITISTDAHHPDEVDKGYNIVLDFMSKIGYKNIHKNFQR